MLVLCRIEKFYTICAKGEEWVSLAAMVLFSHFVSMSNGNIFSLAFFACYSLTLTSIFIYVLLFYWIVDCWLTFYSSSRCLE